LAAATTAASPPVATSHATVTARTSALRRSRRRRREPFGVPRRDEDMRTLGGETLGDGKANADAAAGDHRNLVAQPEIHRSPPPLI
jgi:hypothetical protein